MSSNKYLEGPMNLPGCQESSGKILKQRWLAQQLLKRPLKRNEFVSKIDSAKDFSIDNIIVFNQMQCARRWHSENKNSHLVKLGDGTYTYDWEKIREEKKQKELNGKKHRQQSINTLNKIKEYLKQNPGSTIKQISVNTNIPEGNVRDYCGRYNLPYHKQRNNDHELLNLSRKEFVDILNQYKIDELMQIYNLSMPNIRKILRKRGVKIFQNQGIVSEFKRIRQSTMKKKCEFIRSKLQACDELGVCEENFDIEAVRHNYHKYVIHFKTSEEECKWTSKKKPESQDIKQDVQLNISEPDSLEKKLFEARDILSNVSTNTSNDISNDIPDNTVPDIPIDPVPFDIPDKVHEDTYSLEDITKDFQLTLGDIMFLTGRSADDLIQNGNIPIHTEDVDRLKKVREVLTKDNLMELLKGHDSDEIARFYGYRSDLVAYIISRM